ncbi:PAS domain-containing protein [Streptomyces sp. NPDC005202]|uniref:PAS domain-containing protein n=1 Tax=Streptomyces sp. NPDC005202 TaxID=3157021 RepID=UPI0033A9D95E
MPPARTAATPVELIGLPGALHKAAQMHREALLRESLMAASAGDLPSVPLADLQIAHDTNHLVRARVTAASERHSHGDLHTVRTQIPDDAQDAVHTLCRVLDVVHGRLLTRPALPQIHALNRWLLGQITAQLAGHRPTAWTEMPREPSTTPPEPAAWDPSRLQASSTPTIAADDGDRIIAANAAASDLLGWAPGELIGQRITTIIPEHLRERHVASFTSPLLTGHSRILGRPVSVPVLRRGGSLVEIDLCIQTRRRPTAAPSSSPASPGRTGTAGPVGMTWTGRCRIAATVPEPDHSCCCH